MKIDPKDYRVIEGDKEILAKSSTLTYPLYKSDSHYSEIIAKRVDQMREKQQLLFASNRYSLLIIFQAMDAAGKDSVIKHIMAGVNPQGCQVFSFKHPTGVELAHDFLWRTTRELPERGRMGIFNRSYYEEVLIVRVHPEIFRSERIPDVPDQASLIWDNRFRSIRDLEQHLHRSGTRVIKIFLNLSKAEQAKRFVARIDDPDKNWKFSRADMAERNFWDDYMMAYAGCLAETSTSDVPWYIVPADDKKNTALIVSQIVLDTIDELQLEYPVPSLTHRHDLREIRAHLTKGAE